MPPRNCDNVANDSGKISMEPMMAKLQKGVESTNAGVKEMRNDLSTMNQQVDSLSNFIKQLEN